ncbi:MAG: hypothetical protein J6S26_04765 [Solobacterium sp.]|nr:hypothetical protein [Solobacterium sp.]
MELNWLETTDWKEEDGAAARLIRFRKEFERGKITKDGIIRITAYTP